MDLGLKGKVAFVTGVGSPIGFGRSIAKTLAREGAIVIACSRGKTGVEECVTELRDISNETIGLSFDVTDAQACMSAVEQALDTYGHIDILINNAGASKYQNKPFVEMTDEDIDFDIITNLRGQMNVAGAILPSMIRQHSGNIINFAGGRGIPGLSCYGAAKGGVIEWTYALAREVGSKGIQVNVFGPGLSRTGLVEGQSEQFMEMVASGTPQKRLCTAQEVADIVTFLCSPKNSYMTGIHIPIQMS